MGKYPRRKSIDELDISERVKILLKDDGFEELYPPQSKAVDSVLNGDSCVFAYPTASGKTLLAYFAILKQVIENNGKALYIVPLRALASEKKKELERFKELGISSVVSMGDYDTVDPNLKEHDVIVATSEKADSLLRHNVDWIEEIDVIISDEIHLVNEQRRGTTLEVTLSKLREANPDAQMIALSATINNSEEIAEWLDAKHFESDWRPVELSKGVAYDHRIEYENGHIEKISNMGSMLESLVLPTVDDGDQCLVFVRSRRSTSSVAKDLQDRVSQRLSSEESEKLREIAEDIRSDADTSIGNTLADCIQKGTAFHHAGLSNKQKAIVEEKFRERLIKVISATPTLAAGVNTPAHRVVIRDCRRYDADEGCQVPLPVLEIQQMIGRAGRPDYDDEGEAILLAKNERDVEEYLDKYILGESETIGSHLGNLASLRTHIMALIATGYADTPGRILSFLDNTFFSISHNTDFIKDDLKKILSYLSDEGLITTSEKKLLDLTNHLRPTHFGKKVSDLYIDPTSAVKMKDAFRYRKENDVQPNHLSYLNVICSTPDMYTRYLTKQEKNKYAQEIEESEDKLLQEVPWNDPSQFERFMKSFKTANILYDWINERGEDELNSKYGVDPGDVYNITSTAEWLTNAMTQLSSLFDVPDHKILKKLNKRLMHGVRKELLPLTGIRNVGRVRARSLYNAGYQTPEAVQNATPSELERVSNIGPKLADRLSSIERTKSPAEIESKPTKPAQGGEQTSLKNF